MSFVTPFKKNGHVCRPISMDLGSALHLVPPQLAGLLMKVLAADVLEGLISRSLSTSVDCMKRTYMIGTIVRIVSAEGWKLMIG